MTHASLGLYATHELTRQAITGGEGLVPEDAWMPDRSTGLAHR